MTLEYVKEEEKQYRGYRIKIEMWYSGYEERNEKPKRVGKWKVWNDDGIINGKKVLMPAKKEIKKREFIRKVTKEVNTFEEHYNKLVSQAEEQIDLILDEKNKEVGK